MSLGGAVVWDDADYQLDHEATTSTDQEPTMSADHQAHGATIAEAARHLGISENAVRQRIKRGTVPALKSGRRR